MHRTRHLPATALERAAQLLRRATPAKPIPTTPPTIADLAGDTPPVTPTTATVDRLVAIGERARKNGRRA